MDPLPSDEDRLETLMDKLSMWQLMSGLERSSTDLKFDTKTANDERDWMQTFFEELIELQYVFTTSFVSP